MTELEAAESMQRPEYANRTRVDVRMDGDNFVAAWDGREFRAGNPFGLDSKMDEAGVPQPRNLFLIDNEEDER